MPIIKLEVKTADKTWKALIETGEPVHRIPPSEENLYVISHSQLARLQQLQLPYEMDWLEWSALVEERNKRLVK